MAPASRNANTAKANAVAQQLEDRLELVHIQQKEETEIDRLTVRMLDGVVRCGLLISAALVIL